jgi:nitroreductase/NAD-dependent dihydropyrimidine dehydrogenase PreA subunit
MLQFEVQTELCTQCGLCAGDCPSGIINLKTGHPAIAPDREKYCLRCEHCMAICPTGAISILGVHPEELQPLPERFPSLPALETLIRSRRSVRNFEDENVDAELLNHILEVAWQAPTGKNDRQVRFTVVDDRIKMAALREKVMSGIERKAQENLLPDELSYYAVFARRWKEKKIDMIFRGAPHLLIATAPASCTSPYEDCLIALATFDLFAQANGIGTTWVAYAKWAIHEILPELKEELGIPADHVFGFALIFGKPAIQYARTVLHRNPIIHRIK